MKTIRLPYHNWDLGIQQWAEYPTEMFVPLITYLLTTKRWEEDNSGLIKRVNELNTLLHEFRLEQSVRDREAAEQALEDAMRREWGTVTLRGAVDQWYERDQG